MNKVNQKLYDSHIYFKAKEPTQFRYRLKGINMVTCYGNSMVPIESFRTSLIVPRHEYKPKFKA